METSKQRLRRAMRLPGPTIGLKRSQTDTTNGQAQLRLGYQAEGGVELLAAGPPHLRPMPTSLEYRGVAELTDNTGFGTQTEHNEERPLTLQHNRRHTAGGITSSLNLQPAPRLNDTYMEPADIDERPIIKIVETPRRTSSADGSDLIHIERDPFCRPWDSKSILNRILSEMAVASARDALQSLGVTDLWLPLSKQLLKRSLNDPYHVSEFLKLQDRHLSAVLGRWKQLAPGEEIHDMMFNHCEFEDDEEIFEDNRVFGEGLVGLVEEVTVRSREPPIICVRKKIMRPKQLKAHQKIMSAFMREIRVMRQVNHRHCVRFLGSYTDNESVNILSLPVAEMDLAALLDKHFGDYEWPILYKGIDCLCNGL
ncbi:hypothetical protein J4E93_002265 [Alternaria ventricosa]|uniref:uncharacterized protein n=1 Tax=Alternaria ventricosa TaxID=1187951 RepID=UPI0020C580B1|nr:uncharacterized protein J4E93_002265 [Alternaria ventricosa]KAI4652068.1 hypothetical protein J4E93_002265 [Alternaria ventricosa]